MKTFCYFLLGFLFVIAGCSSIYMPNVPNTPMLTNKGELHASGHITLKDNATFNSAYAVSDNFAILLNGSYMNNDGTKKDFRHSLVEAGGGYFTTFGSKGNRILEIYAGIGRGNSERTYNDRTYDGLKPYDQQNVSLSKYFMQVNYSSKRKKDFKLFRTNYPLNYGTALRVSYVEMNDFTRNDVKQLTEDNVFLEPIFFTRMQLSKTVQLQFTSGSNFGLINRKFLTAGNSVLSVGIVINTGGKSWKH